MNCVKGDLAVNIFSHVPERVGAIVKVIEPWVVDDGYQWVIEWHGSQFRAMDRYLRPIRNSDGDDETFAWAGKPEVVFASFARSENGWVKR